MCQLLPTQRLSLVSKFSGLLFTRFVFNANKVNVIEYCKPYSYYGMFLRGFNLRVGVRHKS